jgi:hypothetical protein
VVSVSAAPRFHVVTDVVLASSNDLSFGLIALEPGKKMLGVALDPGDVFARGLGSTAPARVSERVDVRGPKVYRSYTTIAECSSLVSNYVGDLEDEVVVESSRHL